MNEYEIVELTINDLPECSSFWGYPNTRLEEFLKSGARKVFAYKAGDEYVGGCALIIRENQTGHFSDFFVREDLRGKGIGSRILESAINCFRDKGIKTIRLHVNKDNSSAIRLYVKYSFEHFEDMTPEKIAMIRTV
jgi:ribosomal protein S18 acetylase RimI-like enzyme